jgi:hypothetical protein
MRFVSIGIDGGLSGAAVAVDWRGGLLGFFDMPVIADVKKTKVKSGDKEGSTKTSRKRLFDKVGIFRELQRLVITSHFHEADQGTQGEADKNQVVVFLEKALPMPDQSSVSTFNTGRGFGLVEMALCSLGVDYRVIPPATWMRVMHKGVEGQSTKIRSMLLCERLFPTLSLKRGKGTKNTMESNPHF